MKVSKEFTFFAVQDSHGNARLVVCNELTDLVSIDGLMTSAGTTIYYFDRAEKILEWVGNLGFRCVATKRLIEVEIP